MAKNWKKITAEKKLNIFWLQFTHPHASKKEVQATEEAFSPQREHPALQNMKLKFLIFSIFFWSFLPSWIRIRIRKITMV